MAKTIITVAFIGAMLAARIGFAAGLAEDEQLEAKLRNSDPLVLSMFPAKGFKDGVTGFFKRYRLHVVAGSEQAWCQDENRGSLKPGCYVVVFMQIKGARDRTPDGTWCGSPARWYKAPGSSAYVPVPAWAMMALPIAQGNSTFVLSSIHDDNRRLCN